MRSFGYLIENFFTHKDKLAPAEELPGTMFTPLHFAISAIILAAVIVFAVLIRKSKLIKPTFIALWAVASVFEVVKIVWESTTGNVVQLEITGILPLYPCSVFMYAMPFAIWGKGAVKRAACGYVCTIGIIGGAINFFYPMTVLFRYSIISFSAMHSMLYHAIMLFVALTMLISGYHRYSGVKRAYELLLPAIPLLIVSIPANIVNYTLNTDYMFFRGTTAFFPAIFGDMNKVLITVIFYVIYTVGPACFYLPSYILGKRRGV